MPTTEIGREELRVLYDNYGKVPNNTIQELLGRILIVQETSIGRGSVHGFYTVDDATMRKIRENPRGYSHSFDFTPGKLVEGLKEFKTIPFLVKSSSRFFLKPDIGEIFDQMSEEDLKRTKAVWTHNGDNMVVNNEGDHFVCTVTLLE